ncbi:MAG: ATP-binding protein [bacterium]|nr:ATP-binding protein [bacterium]
MAGRLVATEASGSVVVEDDYVWLRRAIENLIANAVAHTPESTPIEIEVNRAGEPWSWWLITDSGSPSSVRSCCLTVVRSRSTKHPLGGVTAQIALPLAATDDR